MIIRLIVLSVLAGSLLASTASAQPQIGVSTSIAAPGERVTVTVTGAAGEFYAVLGSTVNAGFSYAGVPLGVGSDVVILAQGVLGASGEVSVEIAPPFTGTTLDRYYLQAVTSTSQNFVPPVPSPSRAVRNGDLVLGLPGTVGPEGPPRTAGASGTGRGDRSRRSPGRARGAGGIRPSRPRRPDGPIGPGGDHHPSHPDPDGPGPGAARRERSRLLRAWRGGHWRRGARRRPARGAPDPDHTLPITGGRTSANRVVRQLRELDRHEPRHLRVCDLCRAVA